MSADDLPRCSNKSDVLPDALCGWLPGHRGECTFVGKERRHLRDAVEARDAEIERLRSVLDEILVRHHWVDAHPGRPAKQMLNAVNRETWNRWHLTLIDNGTTEGDTPTP